MNTLSCPARERPFSYSCSCCSRCCKDKIIRVNPYETARLASLLQISTSDFLRTYTWTGGAILRMPYRGNCIFRNTEGCAVHEARPLVCRLYPLRRDTHEDGSEVFDLLDFDQGCVGLISNQGTVAGYLSEQKAMEYLDVIDGYIGLVDKVAGALKQEIGGDSSLAGEAALKCVAPSLYDPGPVPEWLDMDPVVSGYCLRTGLPAPRNVEEKASLHIKAVETWLAEKTEADRDFRKRGGALDGKEGSVFSQKPARAKALARTLAVLGYSIGVNLDELSREIFGTLVSKDEPVGLPQRTDKGTGPLPTSAGARISIRQSRPYR
jgi:uncharacterized protein